MSPLLPAIEARATIAAIEALRANAIATHSIRPIIKRLLDA